MERKFLSMDAWEGLRLLRMTGQASRQEARQMRAVLRSPLGMVPPRLNSLCERLYLLYLLPPTLSLH